MTVQELINELSKCDPDMEVAMYCDEHWSTVDSIEPTNGHDFYYKTCGPKECGVDTEFVFIKD